MQKAEHNEVVLGFSEAVLDPPVDIHRLHRECGVREEQPVHQGDNEDVRLIFVVITFRSVELKVIIL